MLVYRLSLCALVLLLGACHGQPDTAVTTDDMGSLRIAQLGHDPRARFVRCYVMTCPTVTLKHLRDAQAASLWVITCLSSQPIPSLVCASMVPAPAASACPITPLKDVHRIAASRSGSMTGAHHESTHALHLRSRSDNRATDHLGLAQFMTRASVR